MIETEAEKKEIRDDSVSATLYNKAISQIKRLVISEEDSSEVYAVIENGNHIETLDLSSSKARNWLRIVDQNDGRLDTIHTSQVCKNVIETIEAKAQFGEAKKKKIHLRIAFENDTIYYDLGSPEWSLVKIDQSGIDLVPMTEETPLFRRSQSTYEQVEPKFDNPNALDEFTKLLKVKDDQIFKVHLCSLFLPHIPIPMMDFVGEAGTMKSTVSAATKMVVDPSGSEKENNLCQLPIEMKDLAITVYQRYYTVFENVSQVNKRQSDFMCTAITGGNIPKRTLFKNKDETIMSYKRKIAINGVAPTLNYPDLLDRTIFYERLPVDEANRLTDEEFKEEFEKLRPSVLGNIFGILQKTIVIHKEIQKQVKKKTRLADYEVWGESISRAMGYEPNSFLNKYYALIKKQAITQKNSDPLTMTIAKLVDTYGVWEGSATQFFTMLKNTGMSMGIEVNSQHENFPKSSSVLSTQITERLPTLKKLGINVKHYTYKKSDGKYTKGTSMYRLSKIVGEDGEASEGNFII